MSWRLRGCSHTNPLIDDDDGDGDDDDDDDDCDGEGDVSIR